jgi:hypothetical protein
MLRRFHLIASLAALLGFGLGQVSVLLHVEHRHRLCLEHGVVEEAAEEADSEPRPEVPGWDAGTSTVAPHVSCDALTLSRSITLVSSSSTIVRSHAGTQVCQAPRPTHFAQLRLWARAPKQSPPV